MSSIHFVARTLFALLALLATASGSVAHAQSASGLPAEWIEQLAWRSIGPANMSGRVVEITVSETDPSVWWIATASGGLIKTVNNGVTFEHQFDREATVSVGHSAVAPSDHNIIWVGTGEANPRNSVSYGDGVYKSTDGGKTWTNMGLKDSFQIGRIAIHPQNPDIVYVGALGRLYGPNDERGLYKTTDGGKTWSRVLFIDDKTGVIDVDMVLTAPDTLYVATYERERDLFDTNDPSKRFGPGAGIYKTTDGGATWIKLTNGLPTVNLGRVGIDVHRANPEIVIAIVESERIARLAPQVGFMGMTAEDAEVGARLRQITPGGPAEAAELKEGDIILKMNDTNIASNDDLLRFVRTQKVGDKASVQFVRNRQFMFAEVVFTERENPDQEVFPGELGGQPENVQENQGLDAFQTGGVYRSEDGGATWTRINSLNPRPMYYSQIRIDPLDPQRVYVCGTALYRSDDGGKTFTGDGGRGGVHVDHHALWINPRDPRHMILGNDGGCYVTYDRMESWEHHNKMAMGQFYHVGVDTRPFYNVYGGLQDNGSWGGPSRSRTGGIVNSDWFNVGGGDGFVTIADPNDPDQIYFESQNGGMGRIHLATGERGFIRPQAPRGTRYRFNWNTPFALSHHNSRIYYAAGSHVFRSLDRGNDIRAISPEITRTDRGSATAFGESHHDPNVLFVGTDDGAIWMTTDGGTNWTNLYGPPEARPEPPPASDEPPGPPGNRQVAMLRQMLSRLDADGDGRLVPDEVPARMRGMFEQADVDKNGVIDAADLDALAGVQPEPHQPTPATPMDLVTGRWAAVLVGEALATDVREFTLDLALNADQTVSGTLESPTLKGTVAEGAFKADTRELTLRLDSESGPINVVASVGEGTMTGDLTVAGGLLTVKFEAKRGDPPAATPESSAAPSPAPVQPPQPETPDAAPADPVSGVWEGTLQAEQLPPDAGAFTMTLALDANGVVTGEVVARTGGGAVRDGTYNRETGAIAFTIDAPQVEVAVEGMIEGTRMTGTVRAGSDEQVFEIAFEASKIKRPELKAMPISAAARFDDLSGEWDARLESDMIPPDQGGFSMSLRLDASGKVTGTVASQMGEAEISEGVYNAESKRLTFSIATPEFTASFEGKIGDDGSMSGTLIVGGGQFEAPFTAKRTQAAQPPPAAPVAPAPALPPAATPPASESPAQPTAHAPADPVSGDWMGTYTFNENALEFELSLKMQEGGRVSGTYRTRFADSESTSGSFAADTGRLVMEFSGERGATMLDATVKEGKLTGRLTIRNGQTTVDFEASRAAKPAEDAGQPAPSGPTLADLIPRPMFVAHIETSRHQAGRVYVVLDGHRSDLDDPFVFASEDYGATWRSITNGLPRGSTRILREDLVNPDILYLGTEFAIWVSVDRGGSWTRLNANLPTVAIHDIAQHPTAGEIVAATHGRSLWILDVTTLRQMTKEARDARAHLFRPADATIWRTEPNRGQTGLQEFVGQNPPSGATLYYSLASDAESASLVIEDFDGRVIRELEASTDAGLHRVSWDLRRTQPQQGGARGPGGGGGGGGRRGGLAPTGRYRVVLTVDGLRLTQPIEVKADPDYPASPAMEEAREAFEVEWDAERLGRRRR